jgi:predicted P-loop ATPase
VSRLWLKIDETFHFRPGRDLFQIIVEDTARRNQIHPVCDYLNSLKWDGSPRLDDWLTTYGGAESTDYTRAVGSLMLIAAVRRVRQPGCKFDEMPVFISAQGKNKSSALAVLAIQDEWFSDDLPLNVDAQKTIERTEGRWIVEAAELGGMRKGGVEHLKAFLSRGTDRARMAYGRLPKSAPRQFIIIGTTNSETFLRDSTGNRRFWPVATPEFDLDILRRNRDQLWAEAAAREAAGVSIRLDPQLWASAAEQQEERRIDDPWVSIFAEKLGDFQGRLKPSDAWAVINIPEGQRTQEHNQRLGEVLRAIGFNRKKIRFGGDPEWGYYRGDSSEVFSAF